MGIRVELEMLAVLLLLTPIVSDGLVMPKCQVADHLMSNIPADVPDHDDLVAKLTCHAEMTSNFDTSLAKQVPVPGVPGSRKTRSAPKPAKATPKPPAKPATKPPAKPPTKPPAKPPTMPPAKPPTMPPAKPTQISNVQRTTPSSNHQNVTHEPMTNQTKPPMPPMPPHFNYDASNNTHTDDASNNTRADHASNSSYTENGMPPPPHRNLNNTDMNSRKKRDVSRLWTLYGVFQLPDRVACTSPRTPSMNICNLSCNMLIDDDITDDISCALAIINSKPNINTNPVGQAQDNRLLSTLTGMLLNSCSNMNYNQYLVECNNP